MTMPLTSITQDAEQLTLTVGADYAVPRDRLWEAFADLEAMEHNTAGMEEGLRAAVAQLDTVLTGAKQA